MSWDGFVRRYNADLANDFGNLVNRTVSMANRYLGGERPAPRAETESPLGNGLVRRARALSATRSRAACSTTRSARSWEFVGDANKVVDAEQPWALAKAAKAGDEAAG